MILTYSYTHILYVCMYYTHKHVTFICKAICLSIGFMRVWIVFFYGSMTVKLRCDLLKLRLKLTKTKQKKVSLRGGLKVFLNFILYGFKYHA